MRFLLSILLLISVGTHAQTFLTNYPQTYLSIDPARHNIAWCKYYAMNCDTGSPSKETDTTTWHFDRKGKFIARTEFDTGNAVVTRGRKEQLYLYDRKQRILKQITITNGSKLVTTFKYDTRRHRITVHNMPYLRDTVYMFFQYDQKGVQQSAHYINTRGDTIYTYRRNGNTEIIYNWEHEAHGMVLTDSLVITTHSPQHISCARRVRLSADWRHAYRLEEYYDAQGRPLTDTLYDDDGSIESNTCIYNSSGDVMRWICNTYSENDTTTDTIDYVYNNNRQLISSHWRCPECASRKTDVYFEYNEKGLLISRTTIQENDEKVVRKWCERYEYGWW